MEDCRARFALVCRCSEESTILLSSASSQVIPSSEEILFSPIKRTASEYRDCSTLKIVFPLLFDSFLYLIPSPERAASNSDAVSPLRVTSCVYTGLVQKYPSKTKAKKIANTTHIMMVFCFDVYLFQKSRILSLIAINWSIISRIAP